MKRHVSVAIACAATACALAAPPHHQEPKHPSDLKNSSHEAFTDNAPDGLKDAVPHFAIVGKEGKFYLGIGGTVKVTAGEDWGAPIDNPNEFITSDIAPVAPGDGTKFQISAQQSSLYLNFVALPDSKDKIGAFIGMNFLNNYVPVLQYAYLKWRGIKAGYDYSTFSDNGAMPATIDYEGPNAATAFPTPMISYTYNFGKNKNWSAAAGLELPQYSITPNNYSRSVNQAVPDIPVALKYSWNKSQDWLKFSAIFRNLCYRPTFADKNTDVFGWGIQLSGTAQIVPNLRGYWTGVYGHGIASYIQDINGMYMDLMPYKDDKELKATKTWGAFGGLQYDFTKNVYATVSYSHVRNYADSWNPALNSASWGGQYKYAQYAVANVFWNVNSILTTGVEYIYGRRVNNDRSQAHANRLQAMIQLSF